METTQTAPEFPALPKTAKTYKSQRSATMAVNKADRAYEAALSNRSTDVMHSARPADCTLNAQVNTYIEAAWENLEATCTAAKEQGFRARSGWVTHYARNAALGPWD